MVLLPENLDVDPGLLSLSEQLPHTKKSSVDRIRLWAMFFAPLGNSPSTQFLLFGKIFFISSLLNPTRFDWARSFLSFEAWSVILNENEKEVSVSFVLPTKCLVKRKLDCVCTESENVELDEAHEG
jgi:hypothetical protein